VSTCAVIPTSDSNPDQLDRLIAAVRFRQLLELAQSGYALAALRQAILEAAIAVRTGEPVRSPAYPCAP